MYTWMVIGLKSATTIVTGTCMYMYIHVILALSYAISMHEYKAMQTKYLHSLDWHVWA